MELQADCNAAVNLRQRKDDAEITRYMRYEDVQKILIRRTASFLAEMDLTLEDAANRDWLDRKHLRQRKSKKQG